MKVVLDTNIFRQDFLMNSEKFSILFDYLKKTNSRIIMPKIVYQEIAAVYERELTSRLQQFREAKRIFENALINKPIQDCSIEIADEVKEYLTFLKTTIKISNEDIVSYKQSYLEEVVKRAIQRIKPCSEKGEEFRDVLLWLTVLDIANTADQKTLIFISGDLRQFASDDGCLHPNLLKEAKEKKLTIKYYNSIKQFIKDHAAKVTYITSEWLVSTIGFETINKRVIAMLEKYGEDQLLHWAEDSEKGIFEYVKPISSLMGINEFYVYEMTDGSLYVEVLYQGEIKVDFEGTEKFEKDSWDYNKLDYEPLVDELDFHPVLRSRSTDKVTTKCLTPEIQVTFGITVKDKEVKKVKMIEWDFI